MSVLSVPDMLVCPCDPAREEPSRSQTSLGHSRTSTHDWNSGDPAIFYSQGSAVATGDCLQMGKLLENI